MRTLELLEYTSSEPVELTGEQVAALSAPGLSLTMRPVPGDRALYQVVAGGVVGVVCLPDLQIEIRPKVDIRHLLFMLAYSREPDLWRAGEFAFDEETTLVEAVVPAFVTRLERALGPGLRYGYRPEEEALQGIRGRLRFDDQLRRRFGRFPPAEVCYDEFTEDIELNRVLKAAIARLRWLRIRRESDRTALRRFEAMLGRVAPVEYDAARVPAFGFSRLDEHYRPAIALATLILRATSFEFRRGATRGAAFLVDMPSLFEDFVATGLREAIGLSEHAFPRADRCPPLYLDAARRIRLRPDLSWWEGERCRFIGDVKYKRVEPEGFKHADVYQLLAYLVATGLSSGLLIYARGESEPAVHRIVHLDRTVEVRALDLKLPPSELLAEFARLGACLQISLGRDARVGLSVC